MPSALDADGVGLLVERELHRLVGTRVGALEAGSLSFGTQDDFALGVELKAGVGVLELELQADVGLVLLLDNVFQVPSAGVERAVGRGGSRSSGGEAEKSRGDDEELHFDG